MFEERYTQQELSMLAELLGQAPEPGPRFSCARKLCYS